MNKKGSPLIFSLFIILVLAGLSATFLYKQVNQSFLVNRYADSTRAFWLAEAGLQDIISTNLAVGNRNNSLGQGNYTCVISNPTTKTEANNITSYYPVTSNGTLGGVSRQINAVVSQLVESTKMPAGNFKNGIESSVAISLKGSSTVAGETSPDPLPAKYRDPDYYKANSTISFPDLFGYSSTELKAMCVANVTNTTFYNNTWPSGNLTGVIWVTAPSSNFNGNVEGEGLLIVEGNLKITGRIDFKGIVYVIGDLDMAGTATINGTVLAESAATLDTSVTGTANIMHNSTNIDNALEFLKRQTFFPPRVESWQEN